MLGEHAYAQAAPYMEEALAGHRTEYDLEISNARYGPRVVRAVYAPEFDESGRVVGWVAGILDITERKRAEAALQESDERLQFVAERAKVGYWDWNISSGRLEWSAMCRRIFGIPEQETMSYERFLAAVHPDDRMRVEQAVGACLEAMRDTDFDAQYRILRPDGMLRWIHARGSAVFEAGRAVRMAGIAIDVTERKQAEEQLHEASRLAAIACEAGRMGAWHLDVQNSRLTYSDELLALIGIDKWQFGGTLEAALAFTHPDDIERRRKDRAKALAQGDRWEHYYRIIRPDGEVRWMSSRGKIVRRSDGTAIEAYGMTLDITERKRAEEHLRLVMKELSHRTKNLMAVVQAIAWQTAQTSLDLEDFEQRFTQRIEALARSHDLLVRHDWRGVVLEDLVRAQLEPFLDSAERLTAHGPALLVMPDPAQDLGLALHELATNASKYGALSVPSGKIDIDWSIDEGGTAGAPCFHMTWCETGGPKVIPPVRMGFGSTVITSTLSRLKGSAKLDYPPGGLCCELVAPVGPLITEVPGQEAQRATALERPQGPSLSPHPE